MSSAEHVVAAAMAEAPSSFLACLDADQRRAAAWAFPADDERRLWFYTPTDHGGVTLGDLRPPRQRLAFELVASGLSGPGYVAVPTITGLENLLDLIEGWTTTTTALEGGTRACITCGSSASHPPPGRRRGGSAAITCR